MNIEDAKKELKARAFKFENSDGTFKDKTVWLKDVIKLLDVLPKFDIQKDIRLEMDADMQESGVAQGEIESCLNHWNNKYVIQRK